MTRTVHRRRRRRLRRPESAGRPVSGQGRTAGISNLRAAMASCSQVNSNPTLEITLSRRRARRAGHRDREHGDGRDAIDRRRSGHRQRARHGDPVERAAGNGADLPLRSRHVGAGGRPQHQQELSDRHDLGRRRPGQRHDVHHGRRHAQRSVQQPESADAVPRCDSGVQGRDQLAAGALRASRGLRGQRRHQVGDQSLPRQRLRFRPELSLQRPQLLRAAARQPEAQPVRRHARRPARQGQAVLLRRLSGANREEQPAETVSFVPTPGDAGTATSPAIAAPSCSGRQITLSSAAGLRGQPHRSVARSTPSR